MNETRKDVSITGFAVFYVICLVAGGLSILNAFLHAGSVAIVAVCAVIAFASLAGLVLSTRRLARTLKT